MCVKSLIVHIAKAGWLSPDLLFLIHKMETLVFREFWENATTFLPAPSGKAEKKR